jgi:hypothetical protein
MRLADEQAELWDAEGGEFMGFVDCTLEVSDHPLRRGPGEWRGRITEFHASSKALETAKHVLKADKELMLLRLTDERFGQFEGLVRLFEKRVEGAGELRRLEED